MFSRGGHDELPRARRGRYIPLHRLPPAQDPGTTTKCPNPEVPEIPSIAITSPIVRVIVGPDHDVFQVHKGILCGRSEYFAAALNGNFAEATQQECVLDDVDAVTFRYLVRSLYREYPAIAGMLSELGSETTAYLCRLWILADRLVISYIQDKIVDYLCDQYDSHGRRPDLGKHGQDIWDNLAAGSKLRLLILEIYHAHIGADLDRLREVDLSPAIALDLINRDVAQGLQPWPADGEYCRYHVHAPWIESETPPPALKSSDDEIGYDEDEWNNL